MRSTVEGLPTGGRRDAMRRAWSCLLLLCLMLVGAPAWAACTSPQTATVTSGGSVTFSCASFGFGAIIAQPLHGTLAEPGSVIYTNDGGGATSDTFIVNDDNGVAITFNITITPSTSSIVVSPATLPTPAIGQSYSATISASGGTAPYTLSITSGSFPPGLNFDASTGALTGTPTGAGSYNVTLGVTDSASGSTSKSYAFTIASPVFAPSVSALSSGVVSHAYSAQLGTTGGTAPYTYSGATGLPAGLTLSSSGALSGTPTATGSFTISYSVKDSTTSSLGGSYTQSQSVTLTINALPPLTLAPSSAPTGQVGVSYSVSIAATGGNGSYSYSISAGALPPGVSLNTSTGFISGTPTGGGTYAFTVSANDTAGSTGSQAYTANISPATITVANTSLPAATQSAAYAGVTFSASGGTSTYTYAVTSGSLPAGMTLTSSGVLSGTPTVYGSFPFTITATDSSTGTGPYTGSRSFTLSVGAATPSITTASLSAATVGAAYSQTISGSGGNTPYAFAVSVGSLPAGLTLASNGVLAGTPTAGGTFNFTVKLTDAASQTATQTYTLMVNGAIVAVTPSTLPNGQAGVSYSQSVSASGGTSTYTYAVTAGALPAGISLSNTGALSGTPTASGTFNATVTATDSSTGTGPYTGSRAYSITIAAPSLSLSPASVVSASYGVAYSQTFTAGGGTAPYSYTESGSLPSGMTWNAATATLAGTPTQTGTFPFSVTTTDSTGGTGPATKTQNYTLTISAPTIVLAPATVSGGNVGTAYSATLTASGGISPYSFAVTGGSLPTGISLSSAGALSGTPTAGGSFNVTVTATDAHGSTGSQSYTLAIGTPTLVLSPASLHAAVAETPYSQTMTTSGGTVPYSYAITAGALPPGVVLNNITGTLSGTPTTAGSFNVTIRATDSSTGTGAPFTTSHSYTLQVNAPTVTMTPTVLPAPQVAVAYSQQLSASGGNGSYTYAVTGSLPVGLSLSPSGLLAGTPTAAGTANFTVTATDSLNFSGSQAYTVTTNAPALALTPASLPATTAESAYSQSFSTTGGIAPYHYAVTSGALPAGLTMSSAGVLSGTATAAGNASFTVTSTDSSTGTGAPFSTSHSYTLAVSAPTIALSPATLPAGQVAAAYHQQLSATGGNGSYAYSVSAGALPTGLSLSASGLLSGTASAAGNFTVTVTAKDSLNFTGSQAYTVAIAQPVPVVVNDTASTAANASDTIAVTANDTGPITSIAIAQGPTHGTATVNGLNVVYTPTHDYFGSDSLTYTATGPGGTSTPATVSLTVTPLAVPVAQPLSVTILAGKAITLHGALGATGGPFTALTVVTPPSAGTLTISGTDMVYTPSADAAGAVTFDFTLSNAFGVSAPARATITVNPIPVAPALSAQVLAGSSVQVDLTTAAHGGPFTGAAVVSVSPANAGTASIHATANGYALQFTAGTTFGGVAQVSYTLSNAYATSAAAMVDITVTARPDPSKDAEVLGVLEAQVESTRRLAQGQISNFQSRLESLHNAATGSGFSNGISMTSASQLRRDPMQVFADASGARRYRLQPDDAGTAAANAAGTSLPGDISVWTGGAVNFGKTEPGASDNGIDFTTSGLSIGADKRFGDAFAVGVGAGYGHDVSDVGQHTSRSTTDSYNVAFYGSYHPSNHLYADALVGYQWLSFDARRYVTADGSTVSGSRDGSQWFGSLAFGYEQRSSNWLLSPYARLDLAHASLDAYTERGATGDTLSYDRQTVKTTTGNLGLRAQWSIKDDHGMWLPTLRVEYEHDFQGNGIAVMRYADLVNGPFYQASLPGQSQNRTLLGAGIQWQSLRGWLLRFEYQNLLESSSRNNQSVLLGVEKRFDP